MSREVRMVPPTWKHPVGGTRRDGSPSYKPLFDGSYRDDPDVNPIYCMPVWSPEEATHYQMYETTSEGTPISPVFATPEDLAQWLVDNNASAFADIPGTYEGWLAIAMGGYAPTFVYNTRTGAITSGVDMKREDWLDDDEVSGD